MMMQVASLTPGISTRKRTNLGWSDKCYSWVLASYNLYDELGRKLEEAYFGVSGEPVAVGLGGRCAQMKWDFEGESLEPVVCSCIDIYGETNTCSLPFEDLDQQLERLDIDNEPSPNFDEMNKDSEE